MAGSTEKLSDSPWLDKEDDDLGPEYFKSLLDRGIVGGYVGRTNTPKTVVAEAVKYEEKILDVYTGAAALYEAELDYMEVESWV